jgi:Domain of unknown function (DUF927)
MDTRRFLATVVAWESGGYVTVHWCRQGHKNWFGRSHLTLDDVFTTVADLESIADANIYFCLSTQTENQGSRSRKNAKALRSLWMDFDVDPDDPKKYPTVAAAFEALINFCKLLEIPHPSFVVRSGGGLHAYWCSKRDLTVAKWQPYADFLKAAARRSNLKIDFAVTGDASRILRFPGTKNHKYGEPRPVHLLENSSGAQYDFEEMFKKIFEDFDIEPAKSKDRSSIHMADAFKHLDPHHTLNDSITPRTAPLLPLEPIKKECAWLRDVHDTGGEHYDYNFWHLSVLCATFLEDGEALAHEFSDKHPRYLPGQTQDLWERKNEDRKIKPELGWPACKTIQSYGCSLCDSCPHINKGKSPLHIGYFAILNQAHDKEMHDLGGERPSELRLPEGFCRDQFGRICAFVPTTAAGRNGEKIVHGKLVWLFSNRIWDPKLEAQDDIGGISFKVQATRTNVNEVFLSAITVHADQGLFKTMATRGMIYNGETEAKPMIEKFATSWLDKLLIEDAPTQRDLAMGWRYEEGQIIGIVYGGKFFHEDGTTMPVVGSGDDEFWSWYMPTGKREVWVECARLLTNRKRPELDLLIAAAFAAPLCVFAGTLYGPVLVIWGEPGTSKSTAQQVAASVYGHPKQTRESLTSTPKSIQGRLGRIKNFPAYWDDVQDDRHLEALFQTMFVASEGAEGGRLNPDASYKKRLQWQTILVACANASFVEFLTRKQKSTTAGMRRVFEIQFNRLPQGEPGMINQLEAGKTFHQLEHNYGAIGAEYAAFLARRHVEIERLVRKVVDRFTAKVEGSGDESYWTGLCGVLIVGAMLSREFGAEIDIQRLEDFLIKAFLENRRVRSTEGTEAGTYDHTEHAITGFLNHYFGKGSFVITRFLFKDRHTPVQFIPGGKAGDGQPVYFQICRDDRIIVISKRALREYLDEHDIRSRQVYAGLEKWFNSKEAKLTLAAGTTYAQTQEQCFVLTVNDLASPLYDILQEVPK